MDIFARKHLTAWLIALLAAMNLLTLGTLWYAVLRKPEAARQPRNDNRPANINRFLERELGLTGEQAAQFEELRRSHAVEIQALQAEIRRLKKAEMDDLLAPAGPSQGEALAAAVGAKEGEKEKLLYAHLRNLMALCRPDQLGRFRGILGELLSMMAPPGQAAPGRKPPEKKPGDRFNDKPPLDKPDDRSGLKPPENKPEDNLGDEPAGKRPSRPGEKPPRNKSDDRPGDKPPRNKPDDRPGENPPGNRPPRPGEERPIR